MRDASSPRNPRPLHAQHEFRVVDGLKLELSRSAKSGYKHVTHEPGAQPYRVQFRTDEGRVVRWHTRFATPIDAALAYAKFKLSGGNELCGIQGCTRFAYHLGICHVPALSQRTRQGSISKKRTSQPVQRRFQSSSASSDCEARTSWLQSTRTVDTSNSIVALSSELCGKHGCTCNENEQVGVSGMADRAHCEPECSQRTGTDKSSPNHSTGLEHDSEEVHAFNLTESRSSSHHPDLCPSSENVSTRCFCVGAPLTPPQQMARAITGRREIGHVLVSGSSLEVQAAGMSLQRTVEGKSSDSDKGLERFAAHMVPHASPYTHSNAGLAVHRRRLHRAIKADQGKVTSSHEAPAAVVGREHARALKETHTLEDRPCDTVESTPFFGGGERRESTAFTCAAHSTGVDTNCTFDETEECAHTMSLCLPANLLPDANLLLVCALLSSDAVGFLWEQVELLDDDQLASSEGAQNYVPVIGPTFSDSDKSEAELIDLFDG
ncbi:hypothetical protein AB1Y20_023392 [Prymnesium parvum]|uniref:AP2/ERF domain-containing protein n=1 Tax=Prymnesium parvum TaxID=97485 RepID=A0AB34JEI7_PRYPA